MESLISNHKQAVLKRKRAEEEIKEAYDALYEWNKQELIRLAMAKMGEDVTGIEVTHVPRGAGVFSSDKINYTIRFKDGTIVSGDDHAVQFNVEDFVQRFDRCRILNCTKYKNKLKLPRERINKHLPAVILFLRQLYDMSWSSIKHKTDNLLVVEEKVIE